jgi:signal transduction histidine kinase
LREAALNKLVGGIDRTTRMAEQLLDFAKADSHDFSSQHKVSIDVNTLVSETLQLLSWDITAKQIHIKTQLTPCESMGYPLLLGIALRNIVDNAIRYSPVGSVIKIDVAAGTHCEEMAAEEISISVSDQGPGIPVAERAKVTERFYRILGTTATATTGSGLGLSIVERVCVLHSGRLILSDADVLPGLKATLVFPLNDRLQRTHIRSCDSAIDGCFKPFMLQNSRQC